MPRDSLFAGETAETSEKAKQANTTFSSTDQQRLARAIVEVLLVEGDKFHVNSLSALKDRFVSVDAGPQFEAWATGRRAVVTSEQVRRALGNVFVKRLATAIKSTP